MKNFLTKIISWIQTLWANSPESINGNRNIIIKNVTGSNISISGVDNENLDEEKVSKIVYFTILASILEGDSSASGVSFGVKITNHNKELRFFNKPYFKIYPALILDEGIERDTFAMVGEDDNQFPARLEYGQVINAAYPINKKAFDLFEQANVDGAFIQAFVSTTLNEVYCSQKYPMSKFVQLYKKLLK